MGLFGALMPEMAVDLGTANTLIAVRGRGVVLREPSAVAVETGTNAIVAMGREALNMLGRTPGGVTVEYPLRDGVVVDAELAGAMLKYYMQRALGRRIGGFGVKLMLCFPMCITEVERRALTEAAKGAGARDVLLMDEPMAAALGAGLPVDQPVGSMVVDIGGGTTDAAVMALSGIAAQQSVRVGGAHMDAAIIEHVDKRYGVMIGQRTAEDVKATLGTALIGMNEHMQLRGRSRDTGLPVNIVVSANEISHALSPVIGKIAQAAVETLSQTPPELAGDVLQNGVTLCGGGALLKGLDALIAHETGMRVSVAFNPMECVVRGAMLALCNEDEELEEELSTTLDN